MMILTRWLAVLGLMVSLSGATAQAEAYLGVLGGLSVPAGTAYHLDSGFVWGGTLGYRLLPELGVAVTYLHEHQNISPINVDYTAQQILAEANFFTVFFLQSGIHAGTVITKVGSASSTDFGAGAHTGLDSKLMDNLSVGAAAYWTWVTQSNDKHSLFNFMIPIKLWF